MSRTSTLLVLAFTALLAASPAAFATGWSAKGEYEPDTQADVADHYMFTTADHDPNQAVRQVYFNGIETHCSPLTAGCGSINPNVGDPAIRSEITTEENTRVGILGVWKDCNNDNAIGFADQGLWEYRSELLVGPYASSPPICPVENVPAVLPSNWMPVHNDGKWVHEFIPIQWRAAAAGPTGDFNPYNINDNGARMWWDAGQPGDDLSGNAGGDCWLRPMPRGTFHNIGGVLRFTDCNDGWIVTDNFDTLAHDGKTPGVTVLGNPLVGAVDTGVKADTLGAGQISFFDAPRDQQNSNSVLNVKPWGEETDGAYVQAWDCGTGPTSVDVPATPPATNTPTHVANVSQPNTSPSPNTGGSLAGTANSTGSGLDRCSRRTDVTGGGRGGGLANTPYGTEGDVVQAGHAKAITSPMQPIEGARPFGPLTLVDKNTPPDYGVHTNNNDFWDDNADEIGGVSTVGAAHMTYYAYISASTISAYNLRIRTGATGTYGAAACGSHTSGVYLGWECDATKWWRDSNNKDVTPTTTFITGSPVAYAAKVGAPFNLRDIDCHDGSAKPARDNSVTQEDIRVLARNTYGPIVNSVDPAFAPTTTASLCDSAP